MLELAQKEDGAAIHSLEGTIEEVPEPRLGQLFDFRDELFTTSTQVLQEFKLADEDDQKQLEQISPNQFRSL